MQGRLEPAKSVVLLAMDDLKGKVPETPSGKPMRRKMVRASEGEPMKTELIASAISVAKTVEVCC